MTLLAVILVGGIGLAGILPCLFVVIMADRFLVVQDNEDILYNFPTLAEANRTLAELPDTKSFASLRRSR